MSTTVVMFQAAPTPWDVEGRIVGNSSIPLTAEAMDAIRHLLDCVTDPIAAVYRPAGNEACTQAAQIIGKKFGLRARDNPDLDEVGLGLWQGLLPQEIRRRFPTIYPKWEETPLLVTPPDGEPLDAAIRRIGGATRQIIHRNRNTCVALVLRPMALQIASGVLHDQNSTEIARRLHHRLPIETIDLNDAG
jgi:broad specificity phosphatase PhoE